ncbi:uncharacterized protein LOC144563637 [Carex rostrata]
MNDLQEPVDKWVVEIEGRLGNPDRFLRASMDGNIENCPSIFGNWQSWDDFGASFIPETNKWQFVACMTHWFGLNLKSYYEYMQGKVDRAWSYYHGVDEQFHTAENSKRFIEHLLVSSCFLILVMVYVTDNEGHRKVILDEIAKKTSFPKCQTETDFGNLFNFNHNIEKIRLYMITMNYQIPWFVLEAVCTELSNIRNLLNTPIHKFAITCLPKIPRMDPSKNSENGTLPEGGFKHLLHIFHWSRTLNGKYTINPDDDKAMREFHIPSVTELQLSQTVFVKDEGGSVDVCYSDNRRVSGVMRLAPLHLLDFSTQLYESLLRFENHCWLPLEVTFTAYVACMACFLKTESDVRVLREKGIIPGTSFDDKDVLRFVQKMKTFIAGNLTMPRELVVLEENVMAHHKRSVYRLIGEFKKRYCSNTWIIISVIAGILLFVLTFIQALYGTLSYYKQS